MAEITDGRVWWTVGAQGSVVQPPYVIRWKNKWWRTLPLNNPYDHSKEMDKKTREIVESLPPIPYGVFKVKDTSGELANDLKACLFSRPKYT